MTLVNSLQNHLTNHNYPFNHWTVDKPLSEEAINEIYEVKIPEGKVIFDGTRAGDKTGKDLLGKLRVYINRDKHHWSTCWRSGMILEDGTLDMSYDFSSEGILK